MNIYNLALLLLFYVSSAFDHALEFSRSASVAVDQQKPKTDKAGAANIIFKSTDGGQTWQNISDSSMVPGATVVFANNNGGQFLQKVSGTGFWLPMFANLPEKDARTIFETGSAVFVGSNKGLFKSTNGGLVWKQVYTGGWVMKLAESNGVLMATSHKGILRSTDDGENWDCVISEGGVGIDVERIKGGFAAITYNTESETRRVRTSYDGGKFWQAIDAGLPASLSIASIVEVGEYFFCGHPTGIFRSSDKGKTWKLLFPSVGSKVFNLSVSGNVIYAIPKEGGC